MRGYNPDLDEGVERETGVSVEVGSKEKFGLCLACSTKYRDKYKVVYEISFGQLTSRVCPYCARELKDRLNDIVRRENENMDKTAL